MNRRADCLACELHAAEMNKLHTELKETKRQLEFHKESEGLALKALVALNSGEGQGIAEENEAR